MNLESHISEVLAQFELDAQKEPDRLKSKYLGPKGAVRDLFGLMKELPAAEKGLAGKRLNEFKKELEGRIREVAKPSSQKSNSDFDPTLPGSAPEAGRPHPVMRVWDEIVTTFQRLGFDVVYGPEIENEENNFDALNVPPEHPSRDAFDTYYIESPWLLRTHTSPVQIRTMKASKPPIRVIAPGKVFRADKPDAGHSPMFHQVEGLMVGEDVTFAQLKGVLELFAKSMWGADSRIRFRPSFFPFTEPSAEVDVSCFICSAKGCPACKQSGWMEVLGSGMVHPKVLANCGIDPEKYTGFAFGMGIDRICMLKYGIPDIRLLFENHFRFLRQI
jgi:phenylalanyl-tRNA synthetase alpha chain